MTLILSGTNGVSDVDGSASTPAIRGTDTNTGMFFPAADTIAFAEGGAEVARFDSSGNFGIGTSSPAKRLHVFSSSASEVAILEATALSSDNVQLRFKGFSGERWAIGNNVATGGTGVNFDFYDLAASANRVRIDGSGNLLVDDTATTSGARLVVKKANGERIIHVENTRNQSGDQAYRSVLGTNCNNTSSYHFVATTGGTDRFYVYGNGNVQNTNNSYGAISDAKLKENVTDATPKLDKLQHVRVVNFNLIGEEQKQIGVIAQELEQIFPGMVEESPDRDAEGNDLGTTTKSVKYSVFVPMLIKAIQEQQALIESLTARIAALEAA